MTGRGRTQQAICRVPGQRDDDPAARLIESQRTFYDLRAPDFTDVAFVQELRNDSIAPPSQSASTGIEVNPA